MSTFLTASSSAFSLYKPITEAASPSALWAVFSFSISLVTILTSLAISRSAGLLMRYRISGESLLAVAVNTAIALLQA